MLHHTPLGEFAHRNLEGRADVVCLCGARERHTNMYTDITKNHVCKNGRTGEEAERERRASEQERGGRRRGRDRQHSSWRVQDVFNLCMTSMFLYVCVLRGSTPFRRTQLWSMRSSARIHTRVYERNIICHLLKNALVEDEIERTGHVMHVHIASPRVTIPVQAALVAIEEAQDELRNDLKNNTKKNHINTSSRAESTRRP
jgi:hypothetical protein